MVQIMQQVTFQFQLQYGQKQILFCCICSYTQQRQQDTLAATFVPFVAWPRCEISWNDSTTEMSQNLHKGTASHDSLRYNNSQVQGWNLQLWISVSSLLKATTRLKLHLLPRCWNSTYFWFTIFRYYQNRYSCCYDKANLQNQILNVAWWVWWQPLK